MSIFDLIYITNDPVLASNAEKAGVNRIMIDLEVLGKQERQGHLDTVMSDHKIEDVSRLKRKLSSAKLQVRVNPIHVNSEIEINKVIEAGAEIIMLPMFHSQGEVQKFVEIVAGRVEVLLLLETAAAVVRIDQILDIPGIDEIHIGLNDLHLCFNLDFMFELMMGDLLDYLTKKIRDKGLNFGIGGVGGPFANEIVPVNLVLSEHVRLGSNLAILSRSFHQHDDLFKNAHIKEATESVMQLNEIYSALKRCDDEELRNNKEILRQRVSKFVEKSSFRK